MAKSIQSLQESEDTLMEKEKQLKLLKLKAAELLRAVLIKIDMVPLLKCPLDAR